MSGDRKPKSVRFSGSDSYSNCGSRSPDVTEVRERPNSSILRKNNNPSPLSQESVESQDSVFEDIPVDVPRKINDKCDEKTDKTRAENLAERPSPIASPPKALIDIKPETKGTPESICQSHIPRSPDPDPTPSVSSSDTDSQKSEKEAVEENNIEYSNQIYSDRDPAILEPSSCNGTYFIDVIRYQPKGTNRLTNERLSNSASNKPSDSGSFRNSYNNYHDARTSVSSVYSITKGVNSIINNNRDISLMSKMDVNSQFNTWTRLHEKEELQDLNNRFAHYLARVKELRESSYNVDSSSFISSVKTLEVELVNIRNMYEKELDGLRVQLEEASREKNHHKMLADKHAQVAQQLQDRMSSEGEKYRRQLDEFNGIQRALALKESELQQAQMAIRGPIDELEHLKREHENLMREFDTFKRRWDHEQRSRQEAEDKVEQLRKQLDFQNQVNTKQGHEMKDRLGFASNTILSLEAKIRDLSKTDDNLAVNLRRVRDAADAEFRKYKEDSEFEFNKSLSTLKIQIEQDGKQLEEYQKENARLNVLVDESNSKLAQVQGQVAGLLHEKNAAEEALSLERTRAAEQVRGLQRKLNELHGMLIAKMKEFNENREVQIPLKPEIEALRILLEEEEKMQSGINSTGHASQNMTNQSSYNISTVKSSAPVPSYGYKQPTGFVGGVLYSAGATGYAPGPPNYKPYPLSDTMPPVPPPNPVLPPAPRSPPPLPTFQDRPEALNQVHSDLAKLKVLEQAVQDAAGQVEYPYDFRAPVVGPVRTRSAPARPNQRLPLVPVSLGQGRDYFDEMFNDLKRTNLTIAASADKPAKPSNNVEQPTSSTSHDFTTATSSYTEDIRVLEVHPKGKYVRLENVNKDKEYEIGEFMLQQNVGGHTVAVYRFPRRTKFAPSSTVTIWSGTNDPIMHQPPTDFVFQEQQRWGTGPECTTILSKPNGQAISWMTAAHRFTKDAYEAQSAMSSGGGDIGDDEALPELPVEQKHDQVYLRREKMEPPCLVANRHPHGLETGDQAHPSTGQPRPLSMGNDNSTFSRQTRSQSHRPDPVPGQPYAGAAGQRMGSAPLKKYMATNSTLRGNGALANKSAGEIRFGQPTPFLSPLQQDYAKHKGEHPSTMVRFPSCS
ncbi:uncharacterized protein LOC135492084 isoform X2 [Lineus longissimus]|uniref:uncharacterized protein LOC135492084 isoform X2 n=1 Tax=Lineus longissimus TaxID=88925 RepID=UPI00315D506E